MFRVDRCSLYPGSLPLIFNGSVPGHKKVFNVRRCSLYAGVQFGRFHCILPKDDKGGGQGLERIWNLTEVSDMEQN